MEVDLVLPWDHEVDLVLFWVVGGLPQVLPSVTYTVIISTSRFLMALSKSERVQNTEKLKDLANSYFV